MKKRVGNWSGVLSLAMMGFFWLCMWVAPPLSDIYLKYVALPLAMRGGTACPVRAVALVE